MGCTQSASKPVARPDNTNTTAPTPAAAAAPTHTDNKQQTSQATTNGTNGASVGASSTAVASPAASPVQPADVQLTLTSPNGSESQPLTTEAAAVVVAASAAPSSEVSASAAALVPTAANPNPTHTKQRPLIVCGPSGVGKGTLLTRLLKEYPHTFAKSVSHTTRAPRSGEVNGVSYHFTSVPQILQDVQDGKFIEHADVHGNYYGTSIGSVAAVMESGKICLLEIDIQGVLAVRKLETLHPMTVFVRAPTFQDLVDRLSGRGTESEETMRKRLDTARNEMDFFYTNRHIFDAALINEDFETAYQHLLVTLQKLYPTIKIQSD